MPTPEVLLALAIVVSLTTYAVLGGADFGAGVWDLLATGRTAARQRETIARAIAPVWEANHVWLILVVTALFSGFPSAFALIAIHLHIPLTLMLIGIVFRGSAFVFRAYGSTQKTTKGRWGRVFGGASLVTPLLLGTTVGAITEGKIPLGTSSVLESFVLPWVTPFSLAVGVFTLALFAFLAAVYLTVAAGEKDVCDAFRIRAMGAALSVAALATIVFLLAGDAPHVRNGLWHTPWAAPLQLATASSGVAAFSLLWSREYRWARLAAVAQVALIVWGWALAQYPFLVRPHVTITDAAAPRTVLILLLQAMAVGAVVLIPALLYLFHLFAPKATPTRP